MNKDVIGIILFMLSFILYYVYQEAQHHVNDEKYQKFWRFVAHDYFARLAFAFVVIGIIFILYDVIM